MSSFQAQTWTTRVGHVPANVPLVSVVMPVFNAGLRVSYAVSSIRQQTFKNWELIVVDDGSADGTVEILRTLAREEPRLRQSTGCRPYRACDSLPSYPGLQPGLSHHGLSARLLPHGLSAEEQPSRAFSPSI